MRTLEAPQQEGVDSPKTLKVNEYIRISFACGLFFVMSNAAPAATIVDQQYVPYPSQSIVARAIDYNGQSFTAGQWGILKRIEIWVKRDLNVTNDMDWTLFRFNGDTVQQPFLAELTIPNSAIPATFDPSSPSMLSIDLSNMNIAVSPGDYLGMVVHSQIPFNSPSGIFWFAGCNGNLSTTCGNPGTSDGYSRGLRLQSTGIGGFGLAGIDDLAFRTYVELAEPPVILTQPQSQIISLGSNVTFFVLASGTPEMDPEFRTVI